MPTYDYRCNACGERREIFQSITDKPRRKCPACGKRSLQRLISAGAGFLFKGEGFYATDYRSDSYKQGAKEESSGSTPATPAAGAKDEPAKPSKPPQPSTEGGASSPSEPSKAASKSPSRKKAG